MNDWKDTLNHETLHLVLYHFIGIEDEYESQHAVNSLNNNEDIEEPQPEIVEFIRNAYIDNKVKKMIKNK